MIAMVVKAGIIAGIVFIGFMMIMLGISILPNVMNNFNNNVLNQSDEDLERSFLESKEYKAFAERFPNHEKEFSRNEHSAQFQVGVMNPESGNQLLMDMYRNGYDGTRIDKNIRCESSERIEDDYERRTMRANGVMTKSFIETTKCLD